MRNLLGGAVLVVGVGLLGWYGTSNNAKSMQSEVSAGAIAAANGTVHPVTTRVSGRDIIVSGVADGQADRDRIIDAMDGVTGRRVVRDELRVLETASPFILNAQKTSQGMRYSGMIPTEANRDTLALRIGAAAGDLDLMAGSPDASWVGVVDQGQNSLDVLQDGTLAVSDRTVTVSGTALTPIEDAAARDVLGQLPEGYEATFDLTVLDDGTPFRLNVEIDEDGSVISDGKVPSTFDFADLSQALAKDVGTDIAQSVLPPSDPDWITASQTVAAALSKLRSGRFQMNEDGLLLSGVATPDGKAEAEALIATLPASVPGEALIDLYDDGEPFSLEMMKGETTSASGKFPVDVAAADIVGDVPSGDIRNAFIGDETGGFAVVASNGVAALSALEEGALSVVGTDVRLSGVATTPQEEGAAKAAFAALPDGYATTFYITTRDDGTPPNFDVIYAAETGATVSGKLPAGFEVSDIATALNLKNVSGDPVQGLVGDGAQAKEQLGVVASWLPEVETLNFNSTDDAVTITAAAAPGVDQSLVKAGLAQALGGASVAVTEASDLPDEGTTRTNQATGRFETFTGGFWLPVLDFASDFESCNALSAEALQRDRINFVTGSAQLDAQSVRAINTVAAIIRRCLSDTDLNVEIGGHTDSQGGEELNQALSQSRADAVRTSLVVRGVSEDRITAVGYGEAEPIADNATAEGRAANRRTAISWFDPVVPEPEPEEEENGPDAALETENNTSAGE